ncbi:MAG TPA: hypothetical protein DEA26_08220 [Oceanospirillales bacterium]|nr:hypothetical protein [Oceanospirillaceae bacterium]HBS42652.1 hypothetical protein [Oceanospirillales bacterium]
MTDFWLSSAEFLTHYGLVLSGVFSVSHLLRISSHNPSSFLDKGPGWSIDKKGNRYNSAGDPE